MKIEMSSTNTINPKPCTYGCNTRIYWNTSENAYFEVFAKKKHICPNRSNGKSVTTQSTTNNTVVTNNKPNYYNKFVKQPKPKMSNSFELLTGPIADIQKKYEILSDIVSEANGKVHGSQRDRDPKTGLIDLLVYYEVPDGKREECKQRFNNIIRNNQVILQR
jgi:hypothetical protein